MHARAHRPDPRSAFTLIEVMIVVAIIGILCSIALPLLATYQLRSKSTEARINLSAIRIAEEGHFSESGEYLGANAEPALIPGPRPADFDVAGSDYARLGWAPEGRVYFSYAVSIAADASGYTADAAADLDADGVLQIWGYAKPSGADVLVPGGLGCDPARLVPEMVDSCLATAGVY